MYWLADRSESSASSTLQRPVEVAVADPGKQVNAEEASAEETAQSESSVGGEAPSTTVKHIARALLSRDEWGTKTLLGDALDKSQREQLIAAIKEARLAIDTSQPVTDLGPTESGERWAVNFQDRSSRTAERLLLDFSGADGSWKLSKAQLPASIVKASAAASSPEGNAAGDQASRFVDQLVKSDFASIKSLINPDTVTNERLVALGIIFDEAGFQIRPDSTAIRTTTVSEDRAWVVAKVHSPKYDIHSDFGLEMSKQDGQWIIDQINLSSLMRGFASVAADQDTYNPPLVSSPSGGDSIVLYFGYDDDKLTPRSLKQLSVVASLLKQSSSKRIQIGGHADALGEDGYNDALSSRRAKRVAETLRSFGVRGSQINLEAFGERLPLSPNINPDGSDNPEGRGRNRRAEIYLDF